MDTRDNSSYITLQFHNEYAKRMEEEHKRQNKRIDKLEEDVEENNKLVVSVEKLAISVQSMVQEQKAQGVRLEALENRDGEMWRKVVGYAITAIIGIIVGFLFKQIGM